MDDGEQVGHLVVPFHVPSMERHRSGRVVVLWLDPLGPTMSVECQMSKDLGQAGLETARIVSRSLNWSRVEAQRWSSPREVESTRPTRRSWPHGLRAGRSPRAALLEAVRRERGDEVSSPIVAGASVSRGAHPEQRGKLHRPKNRSVPLTNRSS
jgi:hypothetical protein